MKVLEKARWQFRKSLFLLIAFSFVVNILMLTMPLYMLQIYDRILPSQSMDTLTFLSVIAVGALLVLGMLEAVRGILAARTAAKLETQLGADALKASMLMGQHSGGEIQPVRDLTAVKSFISSRGIFAILDLPFAPFFIGLLYFIHPTIFWLTTAGAVALVAIAVLNQQVTKVKFDEANSKQAIALRSATAMAGNDETIRAMGMVDNSVALWGGYNADSMISQGAVDGRNAILSGLSRTLRMILQIAILGVGAYLVLQNQMTAGMIFASSIIAGRGLQPLDQVIGAWKQSGMAWRAWKNLSATLARMPDEMQRTSMAPPTGEISAEGATVMPPRGVPGDPVLNRLTFRIMAGDVVGIVGPSGSGKSTLARLLVGAQRPNNGTIRIDGTDIQNWDPAQLGTNIGYLSQEVRLLPGTVKQNIARLSSQPDDAAVLEAARKAQVHELIQGLPQGYDTLVGPGGFTPSIGQRQRIGLARAFYGNPQIMVLDEPNANLDDDGEAALARALAEARKSGATVVMITQRKQVLHAVDKIMRLHSGTLDFYGTNQEFIKAIQAVRERAKGNQSQNANQSGIKSEGVKTNSSNGAAQLTQQPVKVRNGQQRPAAGAGLGNRLGKLTAVADTTTKKGVSQRSTKTDELRQTAENAKLLAKETVSDGSEKS